MTNFTVIFWKVTYRLAAILQCLNSLTALKNFFIDEKFRSSQNSNSKSKGAMTEAFYYYIGEINSPLNSPNLSLKVSDLDEE